MCQILAWAFFIKVLLHLYLDIISGPYNPFSLDLTESLKMFFGFYKKGIRIKTLFEMTC
jgi:hypothetical protein